MALAAWAERGVLQGDRVEHGSVIPLSLIHILAANPVRVQHRSGALWMLNSKALEALGIRSHTGRLYGADEVIRLSLIHI